MVTCICTWAYVLSVCITKMVAESTKKKYNGWKAKIDRKYAKRTVYAYVTSRRGRVLAALRIIFKKRGNRRGRLPLENGIPRISVPRVRGPVVEISGLVCSNEAALNVLLIDTAQWLFDIGTEQVYAIFNPKDPKTSALLLQHVRFELLPEKFISFPGFTEPDTGNDVPWQVLRCGRQGLSELIQRLKAKVRPPRPVVDMSLIEPVTRPARPHRHRPSLPA